MRKSLILFGLLGALSALPVGAQSLENQLLSQLQAEGYSEIDMRRTLLGRLRITALTETHEREIVINPRTGEVLRDYVEEREDESWFESDDEDDSDDDGQGDDDSDDGADDDSDEDEDDDSDDEDDEDEDDDSDDDGDDDGEDDDGDADD